MRAWTVLHAIGAVGLVTAASFAACSGGSQQPQASPAAQDREGPAPGIGTVSGPFAPGHAANPAAAAGEGVADGGTSTRSVDAETKRLRAVQACAQPRTAILNQPDGGVVFNNAMTSADAGFIDRTQDTIDALAAQSHRFRCCFDLWAGEHPGEQGQLVLLLELSPEGRVSGASIDETRTNIGHSDTTACVLDVARAIDYPASPTGKTTLVEYPFRVGDSSS